MSRTTNVIHGSFQKAAKKTRPYFNQYHDLQLIRRSDNPSKTLTPRAIDTLCSIAVYIKRDGKAVWNHNLLSRVTQCEYDQNNKILNQLRDILNIKFYRSIRFIDHKKPDSNVFVMTFTKNGEQILENPGEFYPPKSCKNNVVKFTKNVKSSPPRIGVFTSELSDHNRSTLSDSNRTVYNNKDNIDKIKKEEEPLGYSSSFLIDKDKDLDYACAHEEKISTDGGGQIFTSHQTGNEFQNGTCESGFSNKISEVIPGNSLPEGIVADASMSEFPTNSTTDAVIRNSHITGEETHQQPVAPIQTPSKPQVQSGFNQTSYLKNFHPFSEDDWRSLKTTSRRDFSLNAMNQILLDISNRMPDKVFSNKRAFLAYMTKVLMNEKKPESMLNQDGFILRNNLPAGEREYLEQEEYLNQILLDRDMSIESQVRKSIADREIISESLCRNTAFHVLKAYVSHEVTADGRFVVNYRHHVSLTPMEEDIIMAKLESVYGNTRQMAARELCTEATSIAATTLVSDLLNSATSKIKEFTTKMTNMTSKDYDISVTASLNKPTGNVWENLKRDLVRTFKGPDYRFEGIFSQFTGHFDEDTKTITLKTCKDLYYDLMRDKIGYYFQYSPPANRHEEDKWFLHNRGLYEKYPYAIKIALVSETEINAPTEARAHSSYDSLQTTPDHSVESNMRLQELYKHIKESMTNAVEIFGLCNFTEISPKKIKISVERGLEIDETARNSLRACIQQVYGDDVKIVTNATRS